MSSILCQRLWTVLCLPLVLTCCGGEDATQRLGSVQGALSSSGLLMRQPRRPVFWSGTATNAPPIATQPGACAASRCAAFELTIDLPPDTFAGRRGGVQVAIRWPTDDNALDLYVYAHDGTSQSDVQVGLSTGILAGTADSLLLPSPMNGRYQIYVALDAANSLDASVDFDAEATVQFAPPTYPIRPLYPDLATRPQRHVTFDTPSFPIFGDPDPAPGESCFDSEKVEDGARTCLRFDQTFANVGDGPEELRFLLPHDPADTSHDVQQRTYFSDSENHHEDSPAGTWEYHAAHHHYHYDDFAQSNLWLADRAGHRIGTAPARTGRKASFCVEDESLDEGRWGRPGVGPRTYRAPDCLYSVAGDAAFDYLVQGLTPGWADIYEWYIPGQYIEVSGLADGNYILETTVDPDRKLIESDEHNNCGSVLVRLAHMGTGQASAELLGEGPACGFVAHQ